MRSFISRLFKGIFTPEQTARKCHYEGLDKNGMRVLSLMTTEDIAAYNRDGSLSSYCEYKEGTYNRLLDSLESLRDNSSVDRFYKVDGNNA